MGFGASKPPLVANAVVDLDPKAVKTFKERTNSLVLADSSKPGARNRTTMALFT